MPETQNKILGICVCRIQDESVGEIINDISKAAIKKGFRTVIFNSFYDFIDNVAHDKTTKSSESIFRIVDHSALAGLVIMYETFKNDSVVRYLAEGARKAGLPVVVVDGRTEGCSSVIFDYSAAFEKIVRHIVEFHKCRKVNFIGGMKDNPFSEERLAVYKRVLEENGIEYDPGRVGYGCFWEGPAAEVARKFLEAPEPPEAIICANDVMAITCCKVLEEHGLRVPYDVLVTGFDGIEQEKYHTPRLTTAYQDKEKAAEIAADMLIRAIETGSFTPEEMRVPYSIGNTQSCGCEEIQYTNVNYIVMQLYERLNDLQNINVNLNSMTNTFTECADIREALPKIEKYIGVLYTDSIFICLRDSFMNNADADLSHDIAPGEKMYMAEICIATRPQLVMKPFLFGEEPPYIKPIAAEGCPILTVPLHYQEKIFGFMCLCYYPEALRFDTLYNFSMSFNHSLDTVKNKSMMLMANSLLSESNHKLENAFTHDSLTGLLNRRGFYKKIVDKFRSGDKGYIFVVSIDLDGLKYINDNFGHQEGDFAIKQAADAIKKCTGRDGICARFGGDEFMSVLFSDDENDTFAASFSKRLDEEIKVINKKVSRDYPIAASSGLEVSPLAEDLDLDNLMRLADEKMYKVKSARGRHIRGSSRN